MGVRIVGISADTVSRSRSFAEEHRITFPLLSDPALSVIRRYGVEHTGKQISLPAVFILSADRRVVFAQVARQMWDRPSWKELRAVLEKLTGGR